MKYYVIKNGTLLKAENKEALAIYGNVKELPSDYKQGKYIIQNNELVLNPNYEAEKQAKEQERIAMLSLTAADVERGIYKAKGMDFDDIIAMVQEIATATPRNDDFNIDVKALKIELKANNFYRGNPYVDAVGSLLGFTKEQLDLFFETGDFIYLMEKEELISEDEIPF